jgi:hypothetical protein
MGCSIQMVYETPLRCEQCWGVYRGCRGYAREYSAAMGYTVCHILLALLDGWPRPRTDAAIIPIEVGGGGATVVINLQVRRAGL